MWLQLWSTARVEFGMSDAEFLSLTLRRWMALLKCKREAEERQGRIPQFMLAQLTALVRNFGLGENQEPAKATDFMPSEWKKKPVRRKATKKCIPAAAWARYNSAKEAYLKQKPRGA